jgi:hypothetical protein
MSYIDQQADGYWRTRTINEAQSQGYTFLRLTCPCGRITDYPFALLLQRRAVTRYSFLGNVRPQIGMRRHGGNDKSAR